jgi:hypothetical protein
MNFLKRTKKWSKEKLSGFKDRVIFTGVVLLVATVLCLGVLVAIISAPFIATVAAMMGLLMYLINHE